MSDLIKDLRAMSAAPGHAATIVSMAVDEIERLRTALAAERERCAQIAEHLNGWGYPLAPELAAHIAKVIREENMNMVECDQCGGSGFEPPAPAMAMFAANAGG